MQNITPISTLLAALALSLVATPIIRSVAKRQHWLARPQQDRWHKKPTALMGGIAIFCGVLLPGLFLFDHSRITQGVMPESGIQPFGSVALLGWTLLFILGIIDDFLHIKPYTKLIGQIIVASIVAFFGFRLHWFTSLTLDTMVTLFWIIGITNAFNLLDNMDGLCAGAGLVCAAALGLILWPQGSYEPLLFAALVIGSLAGFLVYNFNPASIFMGDCGSLPIGFSIAMLSLFYTETNTGNGLSGIAVPILVVMVPIFDTTLVTIIRLLSGRKASMGGRDHTSHRLVLMGFSERSAVLVLYGITAVSGLAAVFVHRSDTFTSPTVIIPIFLAVVLMGAFIAQFRIYPEKEFGVLRDRRFTPVLFELTYKRQLLMIVLDFGMVSFAYYLSYRLHFDSAGFVNHFKVFLHSLPIVIGCKMAVFFVMGLYKGIWDYISTIDVFDCIKAAFVASILAYAVVTLGYQFSAFSKGLFLIDGVFTLAFLLFARGFFRLLSDFVKRRTLVGERVMIYGAGRGGELLLREILNNPGIKLRPVGFVDDDTYKTGKQLQGYPILGTFEDLAKLRQAHDLEGLVISFNGPNSFEAHVRAEKFCRQTGLSLKKFCIRLTHIEIDSPQSPASISKLH
jgi:UDP-GlcNAc:undecaprenyl-phosphate/decaprenyl-phosphate GlcNAc-1-phosphate transferase